MDKQGARSLPYIYCILAVNLLIYGKYVLDVR